MSNNIIPFRPAATGLQEEYQTALFSDDEYIRLNPPKLTFPSDESCEGIALALMILGKEVTQRQFWDEFESSRLSAYIWELRKLGFGWIIPKSCQDRDYRNWHKAEAFTAKGSDGLSPKGFVKRWHKYYLPQSLIDELPPKAFVWANGTFEKWGGHYSGLDAWPDAEA
jgi:hypothetical protein